jgi:hypothetical protein
VVAAFALDKKGLLEDNMDRHNAMLALPRRPLAMFAHAPALDNPQFFHNLADELLAYARAAATQGTAVHDVERGLWQRLLQLGRTALGHFFALHGTGDQGDTVTAPDDQTWQRLPELHTRRYVSIFGAFTLARTVYGSREGQKLEFVPLDNRLQLPASVFSYVLQDWDQGLCVEQAFGQARSTVARILNLKQPVDSLEQMNVQMAERVTDFRENRPRPDPATEGEILVTSGDGKGVVLRRTAADPAPAAHRTKGQKASQKRMATVGTAYTVDRYVRSPEEVLAALFRDGPEPPLDLERLRDRSLQARGRSRRTSGCGPVCPGRAPTAWCGRAWRSFTTGCSTRWPNATRVWRRRWSTAVMARRRCGRRGRSTCRSAT